MKPDKFLLGSATFILIIFMSGFVAATQYIAAKLAYQPQLGGWLFVVKHTPIYNPFKFISWTFSYSSYAPNIFNQALVFPCFTSICGVGIAIYMALKRTSKKSVADSHGTAEWADSEALKKAKLLDGKGVVFGLSQEGEYLRHDGPEHMIAIAPTRSGKGVSIIIPSLLIWPHSVVVTDIKGENWGITSGYRQNKLKNKVLKFDPTDTTGTSAKFNPLEEIRIGTILEVKDTQNVADILVDPQGTGEKDHWANTAHSLLVGTILHVLYSTECKQKSLPGVATFLSDPARDIDETLNIMLAARHDPLNKHGWRNMGGELTETHPVVAAAARELLNKSDNEKSGVLSTAVSLLGLYRDPVVSMNTQSSDFTVTQLMNHANPVSLYLVVPPSDLSRTRPLMRMIINQIGRTLTEKMEFKDGRPDVKYNHRLLLLLDEFPALGRLDFFESALAFIAGYGIKALLIVQSLNQLKKAYTQNNSIMDNCHIRIVYTPNDDGTAELISRMLGQKTELVTNQSYSGNRLNLWLKSTSYSTQEIARPLMTAGEVSVLPSDEEIVFVTGFPPIKARKIFYFKDNNFTSRLMSSPDKSDVIHKSSNADQKPDNQPTNELMSHVSASVSAAASGIATSIVTGGMVEKAREPDITTTPSVNTHESDENEDENDGRQDEDTTAEEEEGNRNMRQMLDLLNQETITDEDQGKGGRDREEGLSI